MNKFDKVLLIPMAGYGKRFVDSGYSLPKQFLRLNDSCCLLESLSSLNLSYFDKIIIGCREEFERTYNVSAFLEENYPDCNFSLMSISRDTKGSLETIKLMMNANPVPEEAEITIFTLDVKFSAKNALKPMKSDAEVLVVKTNNPGFSFVKFCDDKEMIVERTAEKRIISDFGAVGLYRFAKAQILLNIINEELVCKPNYGNEYYICPIFNRYIEKGFLIKGVKADTMLMFGTPIEYEFCLSLRNINSKKIAVASDHSGFLMKSKFNKIAVDRGYVLDDFGCYSENPCDYDDFVNPSAMSVKEKKNDFGVSFCRSGQGVNIAASNIPGIRSLLVFDIESLKSGLQHNAPNHFSIASGHVSDDIFRKFFDLLESVEFEGGRHQDRLLKIESHY